METEKEKRKCKLIDTQVTNATVCVHTVSAHTAQLPLGCTDTSNICVIRHIQDGRKNN